MNFNQIVMEVMDNIVEEAEVAADSPARQFRNRENALDLSEKQFIRNFRLTKNLFRELVEMLVPFLTEPSRTSALDAETKVLAALSFFATGSYQVGVGCNYHLAISQSSISRCIHEVADALNRREIFQRFIRFPRTREEFQHICRGFYGRHSFPGVIGCIDCTHIAIIAPRPNNNNEPQEHMYVNRKGYHSLNVQLICDSNLKILHTNSRFPGSTHDSYIWNNTNLLPVLEELSRRCPGQFYLLGDSGYALRPWMMTPLEEEPQPGTPEEAYNGDCPKRRMPKTPNRYFSQNADCHSAENVQNAEWC